MISTNEMGREISLSTEATDELASKVDQYIDKPYSRKRLFSNSFAADSTKIITVTAGDMTRPTPKIQGAELLDDIVQKRVKQYQ